MELLLVQSPDKKEQNSKLVAEVSELRKKYTEVKAENMKLRQVIEENTELKAEVTKLRHDIEEIKKQTRHSLTQSKSLTEPGTSATSLPQDIINDDSAETLEFAEMVYKNNVSNEIRERNREKKLRSREVLSTSHDTVSIIISNRKIANQNLRTHFLTLKIFVSQSKDDLAFESDQSSILEKSFLVPSPNCLQIKHRHKVSFILN
ncbi:10405_t:CDS:2 [Ambispora gerdemannii]|uniref:10405_t:CDS:1 n=1 Tax=Ambispora gerdemannii TaxID=144530 RepID=A0A9N9G3C1_9GLOM|nr:10405_t:CDS:2 [Ambispora gerdemannii]